jgi:hypothetical protein
MGSSTGLLCDVRALFSDGEPHTLGEIISLFGDRIRPEVAWRSYEAAIRERQICSLEHDEAIRWGTRKLLYVVLKSVPAKADRSTHGMQRVYRLGP